MKKIKIIAALAVIGLGLANLHGFSASYHVRFMGLKVARLFIIANPEQGEVEVRAESWLPSSFSSLNNTYRSVFDTDFLPRSYTRIVRQNNVSDDIAVSYDHNRRLATSRFKSPPQTISYQIKRNTRDFFSLMAYLSTGKASSGSYSLDGNGVLWEAAVKKQGIEVLETDLGVYSCQRYEIGFKKVGKGKTPYVDMVTHQLINTGNKITLWISEDGIPVRSVQKKGPTSTSWELVSLNP